MNTIKFLNSFSIKEDSLSADISAIRSKLYSNGICWTDDAKGEFESKRSFRVILYTRKGQIDFKNPFVKECNGLVVEYADQWKLLAMPHRAFCTNKISMKKLNDLYTAGAYDIYEVLDATILTLYYYDGEWRVSSTKGYDIGSTEMVAGMTFIGAIHDLMETKYKAFKFEDLDKTFSYTIALRHSKYHIFDETKHLANRTKYVPKPGTDMNSYIMVMCVVDIANAAYVQKHVPGLPYQNPIALKDINIHTLTNYARSAYSKYAKAHRLQNFKYKPLYGYILRSKSRSVPDDYSTIYIESELYKAIKIGLYKDNQSIRNCDYNSLIVNMSMNHERYEQFRIMFGQFDDKFQHLEDCIDLIAMETTQRIIGAVDDDPSIAPELVNELVEHFKTEPNVTPGIIKDAMYSKQFVDRIFHVLS